jgi:hypothetical protein
MTFSVPDNAPLETASLKNLKPICQEEEEEEE